jgi:hypothetical protein
MISLGRSVDFPAIDATQLIDINMMPILMDDPNTVPTYLNRYGSLIHTLLEVATSDINNVAYLTIQESYVQQGETQRRPGLHTDAIRHSSWGGGAWGSSGILLVSNIANTTRIYDCVMEDDQIGPMGQVEHCPYTDTYDNNENELVWITDHTPHEALPMPTSGYRQFVRLVFGKVDVWYAQHSTYNELCAPAPETKILYENKFQT